MAGLQLGDHRAAIRGTAGRLQFGLVLASADRATERMRDEGLKVTERRLRNGTYHTVHTRKRLPDVIPGQLKAMLAHQYAHPTRPRSWQHVRMADLALDRESLFALVDALSLRKGEWSPPRDEVVDLWKDGAIAYRREWSKLDTERLVPVGAEFRVILDEWLERREAALRELGVESPWLYPSPRNPEEPISDTDARLLLTKGETVAREELKRKGHNAVEYVPDLPAARWYAYRRAWKANRNELGWEGSLSAAYVGDWSTNEGRTPDTVYARVSPRLILAVVEGKTLAEATAEEDAVRAVKEAARIVPIDLETLGAADRDGIG